ncbi:MAG: hypothetical protein DHS20C18_55700 [Saprospiraceae bacterium]|nr:MAG: hypothetical protein DHS20C18_55700 [Saprospiraceae bacterium]
MEATVQRFLNQAFNQIIQKFPNVTIEYKFSELSKSHIVKVTPAKIYDSESFLDLEGDLYKAWLNVETDDDFGLVTDGTIVDDSNMEEIYSPTPCKITISSTSSYDIDVEIFTERIRFQEQDFETNSESVFVLDNIRKYGMAA